MPKLNSVLNQKTSGQDPRLEVNLDEMFGQMVPNSTSFRQRVGQAIIDKIRERAESNIDVKGKPFKKYSKEYTESVGFAAYGKSSGNVNMQQTGDMLGLLDIVDEKKSKIVIGWTDSEQAAKAYNHITGDTVPKRNFLGVSKEDLDEIAASFRDEIPSRGSLETESSVPLTEGFLNAGAVSAATNASGLKTLGDLIEALADEDDI